MPENVESVAELMLFDSDINVYDDTQVRLPDTAEFNIGGKKKKVLSNQEKQKLNEKRREIIRKQEQIKREKITKVEAPEIILRKKNQAIQGVNPFQDMDFVPVSQGHGQIAIKDVVEGLTGDVADFGDYDGQVQSEIQRKREELSLQYTQNLNQT